MSQVRAKICAKKYKTAETKLLKILGKIETLKLQNFYVCKLDLPKKSQGISLFNFKEKPKLCGLFGVGVILILVLGVWCVHSGMSSEQCVIPLPSPAKALFRPPEDCSMCAHVSAAARVANISAKEFEEHYAYGTVPVIVTDAMEGWRAAEEFSFEFFANFYRNNKMGKQINDCSFFPYKSGLNSLEEVFSMDEKRANLSGEPWYVGWSTCYEEETRRLRSYYNRPYFLPPTAESDMVDWIFMGGPGQGAHMHVDSVRHVSWQAQVRGRKRWVLAPPPECLYRCRWVHVLVQPNECIVVDTNRWYHQTSVLPGDISITIGAEYD